MVALRRSRRRSVRRREPDRLDMPHLAVVRAPMLPTTTGPMPRDVSVATYNVHRWTGISGRAKPDAARAGFVISELGADIIALQEVLRPFSGEDPLERLAEALGLHVAFAVTRVHRLGQLGNAILSRWPIASVQVLDLTFTRMERRVALAASFDTLGGGEALNVVAAHLALVDRTRHRQVESVLEHPLLRAGPGVLLGDMNAWRRDKASRALARTMDEHHNRDWPATYPAMRPVLSLDRIYAHGAQVVSMASHDSMAARRASDHLPIVARLRLYRPDDLDENT